MAENEQLHRQVNELCRNLRQVYETLVAKTPWCPLKNPPVSCPFCWGQATVGNTSRIRDVGNIACYSCYNASQPEFAPRPNELSRQDSHRVENAADHAFRTAKHLEEAYRAERLQRRTFKKRSLSEFDLDTLIPWYLWLLGVQVSSDFSVTKEAMTFIRRRPCESLWGVKTQEVNRKISIISIISIL